MKLEEYQNYKIRGDGVLIEAVRKVNKLGILTPEGADMTQENTRFYIIRASDNVKDLKPGDEVIVTGAAFIPMFVEDREDGKAYFYTPSAFVKFVKDE